MVMDQMMHDLFITYNSLYTIVHHYLETMEDLEFDSDMNGYVDEDDYDTLSMGSFHKMLLLIHAKTGIPMEELQQNHSVSELDDFLSDYFNNTANKRISEPILISVTKNHSNDNIILYFSKGTSFADIISQIHWLPIDSSQIMSFKPNNYSDNILLISATSQAPEDDENSSLSASNDPLES